MKRLSTLFMLLLGLMLPFMANAEVVFNFNALDVPTSASGVTDGDIGADGWSHTVDGTTITVTASTSGTANRFWSTGNGPQLRMYSGTLTITSDKVMTKITFANGKWNTSNSVDEGTLDGNVWEGSASEVVLTLAGNTQLNSIDIEFSQGGATPTVTIAKPTISPATGSFFEPQQVTIVSDVEGAVIKYSFGEDEFTYTEPFTVSETTTVEAWVELSEARSDIATSVITIAPTYTSIAEFNAAATSTRTAAAISFDDLLVTYVNGSYNYLTDGRSGLLVYGSNSGLNVGDRVSGSISGQLFSYNGLPELTSPTLNVEVISEGNEVAPIVVAASQLEANKLQYVNMFIKVQNGKPAEDIAIAEGATGSNFIMNYAASAGADDITIALRNQFKKAIDMSAEKFYDVTGILAIYQDAVQVYIDDVAESPIAASFVQGQYILCNVESKLFWGAGNGWGTQASLVAHPEYVTLIPQQETGVYHLESQVSNGGTSYYFNGDYMDNGDPIDLVIMQQSTSEATLADGSPVYGYTIANSDGACFGWDGTSTVLGKGLATGDAKAVWYIIPVELAKANLSVATADAPVDATFLIADPNFGRNNRNVGQWTMEATNKNLSGGNNTNNCAESYHATFTLKQTLQDVPSGVYSLTAQGFYRQDGTDEVNLPVFYANDETATFLPLTGTENSMEAASASFTAGKYTIDPIFFEVTDGIIDLGARLEVNTALWCIWDNFVLTYYGTDADMGALKFGSLMQQVADLNKQLADLAAKLQLQSVRSELEAIVIATAEVQPNEAAITAAIADLKAGIVKGEAYVNAESALQQMKALTEATNFYNATDLEEYYGQWAAKYDAATLTAQEAAALQNPSVVTAWHASVTVDDFLLAAWDTNPNFQNAPYYINTWSTEGSTDGSGFTVPFFEYWAPDDASLAERTLTGKLIDMEVGQYDVEAWVRVRIKNGGGDDARGITFQVGDGEAVNVCDGQQVGTSQFRIQRVTATGITDAYGVLTVKFNVAADNNVSWLSFKNLKWTKSTAPAQTYAITTVAEHGTVTVADGKTEAAAGETVSFQVTAADGWSAQSYTVESDGQTVACTAADGIITFTMPAAPVTITGIYKKYYNIAVTQADHGTIAATSMATGLTKAIEGETINLSATPVEGYQLVAFEVNDADGAPISVNTEVEGRASFVMPEGDVTVTASFKTIYETVYIDTDLTAKFPVDWQGWQGATGYVGWAAPQVTTNDGRQTAACEQYNEATIGETGVVFSRTLQGLENGIYNIELYGAAAFTPGRSCQSTLEEGDETAVYLYAETSAGTVKQYIPAHVATDFNTSGIATAKLENVEVTDGTIVIGMYKEKGLTNWHVVQIKGVTARVSADYVLAEAVGKANAVAEKPIPESLATAISNAVADNNKAYATADEYIAAIAAIEEATAAAAPYVPLAETIAQALDAADDFKAHCAEGSDAPAAFDTAIEPILSSFQAVSIQNFDAAIAAVEAALLDLQKAQTLPEANLTALIVNPQVNGADGWTTERPNGGNGPLLNNTAFEYWAGNATARDGAAFDYYQVITGLPNGYYVVGASMYNSLNGEEGATFAPTVGLYAMSSNGEVQTPVAADSDQLTAYATDEILVTDGTLRIGVKNLETPIAARWFVADDFTLTLTRESDVPEIVLGDANGDGEVTTSDAVLAVSFVLETETPTDEQFAATDVNASGDITVSDAVGIVNIALEVNEAVVEESVKAHGVGRNSISMSGADIFLNNDTRFVAFQMDVTLSGTAQLRGAQLAERAAGLTIGVNRIAADTWRIVAYSLANAAITANDGKLLSLDIDGQGDATITRIEFADAKAKAYNLDLDAATGIDAMTADAGAADIYSVGGMRNSQLRRGVNIVRKADGSVTKILVK